MNPLIPIIAQYGIEFAIRLVELLRSKQDPTPEDFRALQKYATKTAEEYLNEAKERAAAAVITGQPPQK